MTKLLLTEDSPWHFVNGKWARTPDGCLAPSDHLYSDDGTGIQGYRFAFCTEAALADFDAEFTIRLKPHSDAGLIFRAADPQHFFLLHFPDCGQASRAGNFWLAVSEMSGDGVLRLHKLALIPRVASFPPDVPHRIAARLRGGHLRVSIDQRGAFELDGLPQARAGLVGLASFRGAVLRDVSIQAENAGRAAWGNHIQRRPHWFYPVPSDRPCWQMPSDLVRLAGGELLLNFGVRRRSEDGAWTASEALLCRSADNGATWSEPEPLRVGGQAAVWQPSRLHVTPAGRLIAITRDANEQFAIAESKDSARTWSAPVACGIATSMPHVSKLSIGPQGPVNLADGSMLLFLYGSHDSKSPDLSIYSWGSHHCTAFATLSQDDGRNWSAPISIDGIAAAPGTKPTDGNLDLTEPYGVETAPGRIVAFVRPIYAPTMWETWSEDGGRTWTPCVRGPFPGYASPKVLRLRSGTLLVPHRLPGLTIHCSRDDGRTWDEGTMIDSGLWCMGSMLEVEPGVVLYVYWDSFEGLMRAQFLHVDPKGIRPVPTS